MYPCFLSEKALLKNKKITSGRRKKEDKLHAAEEKGVTKQNEGNKQTGIEQNSEPPLD